MKRSHRGYDPSSGCSTSSPALALLVVLSPILLCIAIAGALKLGRPVLFRQQRPGKDGRLFTILKFRTMLDAAPDDTDAVARLPRMPSGSRPSAASCAPPRSTSCPSSGTCVRGDMSIVGPRPLLPEYLARYNREQARRHEVRPGITGWAQVNGRNATSWEERFKMDVVLRRQPLARARCSHPGDDRGHRAQARGRLGPGQRDDGAVRPGREGPREETREAARRRRGRSRQGRRRRRAGRRLGDRGHRRRARPTRAEVLGHPVVASADGIARRRLHHRHRRQRTRARATSREYLRAGLDPATVIHPSAVIGPRRSIGEGTFVAAGASSTRGPHRRERDPQHRLRGRPRRVVGDHVLVGPRASLCGESRLGRRRATWVPARPCSPRCTGVGEWSIVGAGAAVVIDLPAASVCVGVPARAIRPAEEA